MLHRQDLAWCTNHPNRRHGCPEIPRFIGADRPTSFPKRPLFFIYDNAPAHRNANNPGANSELKRLPPYRPLFIVVEQAISCLKASIKTSLSRPDQRRLMEERDEAKRQGLQLGELRKRLLRRATSYKKQCYQATKMHAVVQPHTNLSSKTLK